MGQKHWTKRSRETGELWIRRNVESSNRYVGKRAADSRQWSNVIPLHAVIPKMPVIVGSRLGARTRRFLISELAAPRPAETVPLLACWPERRRQFIVESKSIDLLAFPFAMNDYDELVELAQICARNAHAAATEDVAHALWEMATEYQAKAAALGTAPNIGDPPSRVRLARSTNSGGG